MKILEFGKLNSLRRYAKDGWNKLDIIGCFMFLLGFCLHVSTKYLHGEKKDLDLILESITYNLTLLIKKKLIMYLKDFVWVLI